MTRILTPLEPLKIKVPDMEPEAFRAEIIGKGAQMTWEMAAECACEQRVDYGSVEGRPGSSQQDCVACDGTGIIYHSAQPIRALLTSPDANPDRFALYGPMAQGMMRLSMLPENLPSYLDRFTLRDSVMTYRESRTRQATVEELRFPVVTRPVTHGTLGDPTTPTTTTFGTMYVRRADADGVIIAGELVEDVDFEIDNSGRVDWTLGDGLGTAPAVGSRYSIHYVCNPRYIAQSFPFIFRDTWLREKSPMRVHATMPVRVDCTLEQWGRL